MVFTRGKVYKNQHSIQNKNRALIAVEENHTVGGNGTNLGLVQEVDVQKMSMLNLQEIVTFLAEVSPFPIVILCLETHEILFKNKLVEKVFGANFCQNYDNLVADIYNNYTLCKWLNSSLKGSESVSNLAVKVNVFNNTVVTRISAKAVNYQGKLAALLVFTDINEPLQKQPVTEDAIAIPTTPENVNSTCEINYQQSQARLHLMERALAASSNGIVLTDATQPDNPIIYVNPAFESITGYFVQEVIGRNCRFLQGNAQDQLGIEELRKALQEQRECHVILKNYRKDGTPFWNELYIAPVFDDSGRLTNFIGVQNDITQHLQALEALQEREEQYRRIVETATEGIWLLNPDNQTTFVNQQMAAMLGYTVEEMLGKTLFAFMDAEGLEIAQTYLERRHQGINETHDFKFLCQDGSDLWAIISCAPLFDNLGNYSGALGMVTNISDRKRAEAALQESKQRLDEILNSLEDVVWSVSAETFETLYINPAVVKIYGRSVSEFVENSNLWFEVIHPEDQPIVSQAIQPLLLTGSQDLEYRIMRPDGEIRWLHNRSHVIYNASGKPIRIEGIATDISERKFMEAKLMRHAFYDHLTGLPNRVLFMDRLEQAIGQIQQHPDQLFAVLFLDLDRFKVVNDSLGHFVGDQLLVSFAERLQNCLRPEDTIARLGGDEFTILLTQISSIDEATRIAEHIHQVLKSPFNLNGYEVFTTTSIGIALSTIGYTQPADLLRDADTALYCAKEQGKAWHIVFDTTMYDRAVALLQLETDLRWAIERQELQVFYQPIVSVATGKITGFESLVRWQHPERGLISPAEFIPIAEETGLIIPIGEFVLRESCQQLRQWQLEVPNIPPLSMNVNLSGKQFSQPYLVEKIVQILRDVDLEPSSLKLEITESAIMASPEQAATILQQFKALGIKLCIDDFGTGYSSLAYLHHFPIDVLKIDRSFVNRIDRDGERLAIVKAIVTLASNLGMSVVAEGVETISQLVQLRLLQCDQAQGHLFSPALNSQNISLLLAAKRRFYQPSE
ncbi:PAS domain S-box/diguanylate cyclase (GGDEF) domain-containing protein [Nostoc sp. PCC 7524]|uniref:sensor domain-containing protein n=1 Tax=Nostoc sp. (strain ATCC 29411 / PCC 7524) TaxID=28072 RepID=UPI00029EECAE|nr:EAL domain-containing protein [Nostoc sp. PCC 7524]AFY50903.1 PAS domain S-box/diguanylate cyclase (GGDEF) domain-containing protein [Nostoc sp. PCC 7524]